MCQNNYAIMPLSGEMIRPFVIYVVISLVEKQKYTSAKF